MPQFNILSPLFRTKSKSAEEYYHEFLVLSVPEEKYGHHTVLVWHWPKQCYRKVVAVFGRMEKPIANAELLGQIRMRTPYPWDGLEGDATTSAKASTFIKGTSAKPVFAKLEEQTRDLKGEDVVPVAVYLAKVKTNRRQLLYDGPESSLPEGYLTFYMGKGA
ncbi:hypothetical protein C8R44DRAFT_975697 [Mycena epipterygia]|nr:hypothetical protein C8R44DRAFT_868073 [Mycena epipterygia]KAJ7137697.1 hypothetical protein C8R44DRAFT_975697 [Mycena epipterygia]